MSIGGWLRGRKAVASATALAVLIAAPVTLAVIHNGFPVSKADLQALDVWVTNQDLGMTARFDTQIKELDTSVEALSKTIDVLQNGYNVFQKDSDTIARIDPALGGPPKEKSPVAPGSTVAFGGTQIAILSPSGSLWLVNGSAPIQISEASKVRHSFGSGSAVAVAQDGTVIVASGRERKLFEIAPGTAIPVEKAHGLPAGTLSVTAVGSRGVALAGSTIVFDDGSQRRLPAGPLKLQQPGAEASTVLVATQDSLIEVASDGVKATFDGGGSTPSTSPSDIAAPVNLNNCIYGAWSAAGRYFGLCAGQKAVSQSVPRQVASTATPDLEFRVNGDVIALNDVGNGDVWLVKQGAVVPADLDWKTVAAPKPDATQENKDKTALPNFEQTEFKRSVQNTPPVATPDSLGVRPGGSAILNVLANDTDVDGDVLTITGTTAIPPEAGSLQVVQNGRAIQFSASQSYSGSVNFEYSITDGRSDPVSTNVNVAISPTTAPDHPPVTYGTSAVNLEAGQTITYNVLGDWYDPDGDDLILESATAANATVRFSPDGLVTYTALGTQTGPNPVAIEVGDGLKNGTQKGRFIVNVLEPGKGKPIATPDFATTSVNEPVQISPLANDLSPSGAALTLGQVKVLTTGAAETDDPNTGVVSVTGSKPGSYYLSYGVSAGAETFTGLIRVDVVKQATSSPGPTAVRDVAYVRPNQPNIVSVLDNDISPSGAVLGIQSISAPDPSLLSVQVLANAKLKITPTSALKSPLEFDYTISDGSSKPSTGRVAIVPLPELTHHQKPIAVDDNVTVRTGGIVSVDVLANDFSPDGAHMQLSPDFTQTDVGDGFPFVTGNQVRLEAPSKAGQYSLNYLVSDSFGEQNTATVHIRVLAPDKKNNKAPVPQAVTARVFAGASTTVQIPVNGIDPDGDSVSLVSVNGERPGTVSNVTATSFVYTAGQTGGTDSFNYVVHDSFGAPAPGQVRIGVIPRSGDKTAPDAAPDDISMQPDRVATVPVVANDSDPNGYPLVLSSHLQLPPGIHATVKAGQVVVTAPHKDGGTFVIHYTVSNGHKGIATGSLTVKVDIHAKVAPPVAFDQVIDPTASVHHRTFKIDVLRDAQNPGGLVSDLKVTAVGPNAALATPNANGTVTVKLGTSPQNIAYELTNTRDHLSAKAFISVPAYADSLPPYLIPGTKLTTGQGQPLQIELAKILRVPSGRQAKVVEVASAFSPHQKAGVKITTPANGLSILYTPDPSFRGETSLTFTVSDKGIASDPNAATIEVPITVGHASQDDVAPVFANQTVTVEEGKSVPFALKSATSDPNQQVLDSISYKLTSTPSSGALHYSLTGDGKTLTMSVDQGASGLPKSANIGIELDYGNGKSVQGQIVMKAVTTTEPPPQAIDDAVPDAHPSGSYSVSPLANDFNPPTSTGLKLVGTPTFQGPSLGSSVQVNGNSVSISTGTAKSGTISLLYTVQDSYNRKAQGRIVVTVTSAPEPVTGFTLSNPTSGTVAVDFTPPTSSNGAPITGYTVRIAGTPGTTTRQDCTAGVTCTFGSRQNGSSQTVDIGATNKVGTTWSTTQSITPYGTPTAPTSPLLGTNSSTATATITPTWSGPADNGGGNITYHWNFTQGNPPVQSGSTGGTSGGGQAVGAGTYTFQVQACNPGGCSAYVSASQVIGNPQAHYWVTRSGDTLTYHWVNQTANNYPQVTFFRAYTRTTSPIGNSGPWATWGCGSAVPGNFNASSGSIAITCSGANDNYSVEPNAYGPWLQAGTGLYLNQ